MDLIQFHQKKLLKLRWIRNKRRYLQQFFYGRKICCMCARNSIFCSEKKQWREQEMRKVREKIQILTSMENTMLQKERFNPYQCGTGIHASEKYPSRAKAKRKWKKEINKFLQRGFSSLFFSHNRKIVLIHHTTYDGKHPKIFFEFKGKTHPLKVCLKKYGKILHGTVERRSV